MHSSQKYKGHQCYFIDNHHESHGPTSYSCIDKQYYTCMLFNFCKNRLKMHITCYATLLLPDLVELNYKIVDNMPHLLQDTIKILFYLKDHYFLPIWTMQYKYWHIFPCRKLCEGLPNHQGFQNLLTPWFLSWHYRKKISQ